MSEELTAAWAVAQAEVTHAHPAAIAGARLVALATRYALISPVPRSPGDWTRLAARLADHAQTDELALGLRGRPPDPGAAIAGTASAAVPAAIHVAAQHGDGLIEAIGAAVELGGDTDTVAAMAGGIVGARLGLANIPARLVERLEHHEQLIDLADGLLEVAIRSSGSAT